ncbi:4-aminobutyrate--2-oxoglutarate transaminase [Cellulomonas soli]|uniref:(S)-3-amino-2-methylpropionate transaminase n=1 Tax=Cellulomonas soli TaxID=931535 RepID=A0A512PBE9_9CELL|nr:4-aminobutyrate--2-oxoglutarate transaminase [Cellulomonas soli]NYI61050.1 4-aminobutyrate aminotransferase/(S)-3-amino-2-methylpropionate transaminase [Cellulomonas soli]GEP68533.1 4-aminobutyrate aminotransferase GabT [Cellulomonas soli]
MTTVSASSPTPPSTPREPGTPHPRPPLEQSRHLATAIPGPRSLALAARRATVVAAGVSSTLPVYVARAGGAVLEDVDGNRLVDLGSGIAVTSVGASAPEVVAAVSEQVADFTHTCFMVSPYEEYVALCEVLARLTPGTHAKRSVLVNSGAEAVENAVKIARRATGRDAVVVLDHAYHGRTNLTMAMTARAMPYKTGFGPFAGEVYRVPASYPLRDPDGMTGAQAAARAIDIAQRQVGADRIAAVVVEPILGEGGFVVPAPGFLPALAAWARENGIVFVADEVQTGFARTGAMFASEHEGVVPDLVALAKGIGGGLPLGAVTGRAELMDAVHAGGLGGTYGGNPVACAAALAATALYERDDLAGAARAIEDRALGRLRDIAADVPAIAEVRGRGAMLGIELVRPGTLEPDKDAAGAVARACLAAGVLVLTCGTWGNVVRLLPPLVIETSVLDDALDVLERALRGLA